MTGVLLLLPLLFAPGPDEGPGEGDTAPAMIVVVGAPGTPEYGAAFSGWADGWMEAAARSGLRFVRIGGDDPAGIEDREHFRRALQAEAAHSGEILWLVLIGHGTFDGREARFNLRGPDVSATELKDWLEPVERPLAVVNTTSSSAPFLPLLSAPGRIVVTATRSGHEFSYARFGGYLVEAILDPEVDLDKDGSPSLLEAFLAASARVEGFYEQEGRLATEHALIDDNGDGRGTPADWFRGVRCVRKARDGVEVDGLRANRVHLVPSPGERGLSPEALRRRDELEGAVFRLREAREEFDEDTYYRKLEAILIELARLHEAVK